MKTLKRSALLTMVLALTSLFQPAHAMEIEVSGQYPVAMGEKGQNYNSNIGGTVAVYFDPVLDPAIPNYISVGYNAFGLKADANSAFRVFPILAGIDLQGKVFSDLYSSFGLAVGGAFGYIAVPNSTTYNMSGYFTAQVKPGLEYIAGDGISIVAKMPLAILAGKASMSYLVYDIGVKFKL
jgi:hypothetical protein